MASEQAAEQRKQDMQTLGYYNLKLGRTSWNVGASLSTLGSDNINYTHDNTESDLVLRPEINSRMLLPVSDVNVLNLSLGVGYSYYAQHSSLDNAYLAPGSELSFDFYTGDFWINLHDRFSITDNGFVDPTYAGTGDYQRLENTAGFSALWDLNKFVVKAGYDHYYYTALTGNLLIRDENSDLVSASASYAIKPEMRLGLELGGGLMSFTSLYTNSSTLDGTGRQWNAGSFFQTRLSEYMSARISAGYTDLSPSMPVSLSSDASYGGFYAQASLRHILNQHIDYSLSGGRTVNFSPWSGTAALYYGHLDVNWKYFEKYKITTSFDYAHGPLAFFVSDTLDWYSPTINVERQITQKLTAGLRYRYLFRGSDVSNGSYTADLISLNLTYRF